MAYEYRLVRRVEFSETDMAGIVHYSNFFRYMEAAEHAFFRSIGYSVVTRKVEPPVGWPRVHAECDYRRPIRFEDEVEIRMYVTKKKSKSLTYGFWFRKMEGDETVDVARGSLTVVCVRHRNGRMKAAMIPGEIARKIEVVPAKILRELMKKSRESAKK
jgi:YbgC/YbaW family acyl-CoA thioester hydrolase